jgi:hypothetical protein
MAILGFNTKGTTTDAFAAGKMYVSKWNLASAATVSELHGWFGGSGTTVRLVIYNDAGVGGDPGARLGYTSLLSLTGSDVELSETGLSISLAAGNYYIGWKSTAAGTGGVAYREAAAGIHAGLLSGAADPPPNPFGITDTTGSRRMSCWAVVTASAGATFVPQVILI